MDGSLLRQMGINYTAELFNINTEIPGNTGLAFEIQIIINKVKFMFMFLEIIMLNSLLLFTITYKDMKGGDDNKVSQDNYGLSCS